MTKSEIILKIKVRFQHYNLSFKQSFWREIVDEALRKYTANSGKTLVLVLDPSGISDLSSYGVKNVAQVAPGRQAVATTADVFKGMGILPVYWPDPEADTYPMIVEDLMIAKFYNIQSKDIFTGGFDWHYDQVNQKLYVDADWVNRLRSIYVKYFPDWKLADDDSDQINLSEVLDWVIDYGVLLIKEELSHLVQAGSLYDLPNDPSFLGDPHEERLELMRKLRARYPYVGMQRV
jgi:hypothetical protein